MLSSFLNMIIQDLPNKNIDNPQDVSGIIQSWLGTLDEITRDKEHLFVLCMDARSRFKYVELVSVGTINASLVHPREVFRRAVSVGGTSIMVSHNHTSGDVEPSDADISVTKRLVEAGKIMGIELIDHLIVSAEKWYSFRERGRL